MIGLDTNVLVRYIVQDDPVQSAAATEILESECTPEEPGFINAITLAECVWVLERAYRHTRAQIAPILEDMLTSAEFKIEHAACAWQALQAYRQSKADFADLLIGRINRLHGCRTTKTFERQAARSADFEEI